MVFQKGSKNPAWKDGRSKDKDYQRAYFRRKGKEFRKKYPERYKEYERRKKRSPESIERRKQNRIVNKEKVRLRKFRDYWKNPEASRKKAREDYAKRNKEKRRKYKKERWIKERATIYARKMGLKGDKCVLCESKENLEFHHTNYERNEGFTLCRKCHRKIHYKPKGYLYGGMNG